MLRLLIGVVLTVIFILGESWINQLVVEQWRGRLVALYGCAYALSQLSGPLLLGVVGSQEDYGFWIGVALLTLAPLLLLGRDGAPVTEAYRVTFKDLLEFCRGLPAIAWAVALFAAFEAMILTLLPIYCLRQGFTADIALAMVSTVVVGDALLQLPIGALADTKVITLQNRTSTDLLPIAQNFIGKNGKVSAYALSYAGPADGYKANEPEVKGIRASLPGQQGQGEGGGYQ